MKKAFKREIVQRIARNLLDVQILRLIRAQPMWGYKIKKQAYEIFDLKLGHGALYPLLHNLEKKGFLKSKKQRKGGRIRRVYTITGNGIQYLEAYASVLREQMRNSDIRKHISSR